ncbi:hypothetical protein Tco_0812350 [Tanacetum coccineum]
MSQPANDEFSQHLSDDEASNNEDASDTGAAPKQQQQVIPQTTAISNIKLPILKKEEYDIWAIEMEYDIWAIEMEHYLKYIDNDVWKVIQNGNSKKRISTGKDSIVRVLSAVTAAEIQAVEKERKAKNILLMAIPKEHMRRFHGMDDAKEIWEAIRTRFGGNANSKKMQKAVFKQQFEAFRISNFEGLEKGYDRFQQLLSQLEAHGAEFCTPSTSSTNVPEKEVLAGFADEVIYSLFAKQTEDLDLLHEDLEQIDDVDIEEMDINWQIAMIAIRMKKFYKKTGRRVRVDGKTPVGFDKKKLDEVSLCSKTCIDSYNKLKSLCNEQMNQLGEQEAQILAYSLAVKDQEAQLVTFQTKQNSLNEKLTFQANEIYEKNEKLKRYRRIGMKALKEKEQLQKIVDSWKNSSKNLCRLINSGMSSTSKVGLGYEIKSNDEVLSYEEEMNYSVFKCSEEDYVAKPFYSRFKNADDFKGLPPPFSGDYTPKPHEEFDDSLYDYVYKGTQKPETSVSDDKTIEYSTCQSNDSEGSIGNTSEQSADLESESANVSKQEFGPKPDTTNETVVPTLKPKAIGPSYVSHMNPPRQSIKRELGEWSNVNSVRPNLNTGRTNVNSIRQNVNSVRQNVNSVRHNVNSVRQNVNFVRQNVNSVRQNVNSVGPKVNTVRPRQPAPHKTSNSLSPKRPQMNQINQRRDFSTSYSSVRRPFAKSTAQMAHTNAVMGSWGSAVKTSASYNWRNSRPNFNYNSGPTFIRTEHPLKNMVDRGIFDSGCSGHMTGNKDQLEDFEEFNGGSVTFGGSKGYISGKGRIRVGNLDFDSVSFVKELGHFNLFSISQICDKQHKVLFTETECLVVSSDFKMPDENQILLKVPRHHNMYSFDMKTPEYAKDNGTKFKNMDQLEFCGKHGIIQEYSNSLNSIDRMELLKEMTGPD